MKKTTEAKRRTVPKDLRALPSDLVTHDAGDKERIHKHDPAHIRKGLMKERAKALVAQLPPVARAKLAVDTLFDAWRQDPFKSKQFGQDWVDLWAAKVVLNWAQKELIEDARHYLWFPDPHNPLSVELKVGRQPPRDVRPPHLKNINLGVQVLDWSARLRDIVQETGVSPTDALEEIRGKLTEQKARYLAKKAAEKEAESA